MRTVRSRSVAIAAIALLSLAGGADAQEKTTALLNSLEVRQLVARGEPADNARLRLHFSALADRYAVEAKRHISMSQSVVDPSRNLSTGLSAHCKRLADLNTQSATTLRELAACHEKLAAGASVTPPRDRTRFQGGAGAPEPTEKELKALAEQASTPAEHHALEEYFLALAKRYTAEADQHTTLAQIYQGTQISSAASLHTHLARSLKDSAKEATEAAAMHKSLANVER